MIHAVSTKVVRPRCHGLMAKTYSDLLNLDDRREHIFIAVSELWRIYGSPGQSESSREAEDTYSRRNLTTGRHSPLLSVTPGGAHVSCQDHRDQLRIIEEL